MWRSWIIILKHTKLQFPLLDVGTGPGFPGIPLKIVFPNEQIYLGEGVQKRVEFLKYVREELQLPNLKIYEFLNLFTIMEVHNFRKWNVINCPTVTWQFTNFFSDLKENRFNFCFLFDLFKNI